MPFPSDPLTRTGPWDQALVWEDHPLTRSSQPWPIARDLDELQARFPDYVITEDRTVQPPRWLAVARNLSYRLYSMQTTDLAELVDVLTAARDRL